MSHPKDPRGNGHSDNPWAAEEGTQPEIPVLDVNRELCGILSEAATGMNAIALAITGVQRDVRLARTAHGPDTIKLVAEAFARGRDYLGDMTVRLEDLYVKAGGK